MNVREIGPNVPLAPDADPSDGLLDLALVAAGDREGLAAYLREREPDHHLPPPALRRARGRRLRIRFPEGCPVHIDDELWPEGSVGGGSGEAIVEVGRLRVRALWPAGRPFVLSRGSPSTFYPLARVACIWRTMPAPPLSRW